MIIEDKDLVVKIQIKNMVCPRCITAVESLLTELGISFQEVVLGEVILKEALNSTQKASLIKDLKGLGFELLEDKNAVLISGIKSLIIEQIHHNKEALKINFSDYISSFLNQNYNSLSRLFSQEEGITIEKFITLQRIEKTKELLFYDQLSLSEIAFQLNYSSSAYLSTQFKKETGMTPTVFKNQKEKNRHSLGD